MRRVVLEIVDEHFRTLKRPARYLIPFTLTSSPVEHFESECQTQKNALELGPRSFKVVREIRSIHLGEVAIRDFMTAV